MQTSCHAGTAGNILLLFFLTINDMVINSFYFKKIIHFAVFSSKITAILNQLQLLTY